MRLGVISRFVLTRRGLCALLGSNKNHSIVLELPGIPDDIDVLRKAQPEVLLYHPAGGNSDFEAVSRLRNLAPEINVLLFLDSADEEAEFQAVRAGGRGCISSATDLDMLLKAVGAVAKGELWVSRRGASRLIERLAQPDAHNGETSSGLTPQEWKVLALLAAGSRNKEIANRLSVSENTVKTHLYTIYRKINVDCRLAATLYYFQHVDQNGNHAQTAATSRQKSKSKDRVRSGQTPAS